MARRPATYLTNAHQGVCEICKHPIVKGQSAVVRQDGKGSTHRNGSDCIGA